MEGKEQKEREEGGTGVSKYRYRTSTNNAINE